MTDNKNRCVVTGLGLISAIGSNVDECFKNAVDGVSGISKATMVDTTNCYANLAAEVKDDSLDEIPDSQKMDRCVKLCVKASGEALSDAGLKDFDDSNRLSVIMGSCVGGVSAAQHYYENEKPAEDVTKIPISAIANHVAKAYHAGGVVTNIANACAAGTISIAYACDLIRAGKADVVIAGGTDAFASLPFAGFLSLHALDENPCSPFNHCNGITLGEGAGAVIIESYEHAMKRKAKIYCEVLGSGISSDAYHITTPRPDGKGQMYSIRRSLENSGLDASEIDYVNAHGTGTAKNDDAEFLSLHTIFDSENEDLCVSSTKSMVGHCLGASGAIEAVLSIKALTEGIIPPTIGYSEEDLTSLKERAGQIDFCPNNARKKEMTSVMSNSFAFGGNNASIIFSKKSGNVVEPKTNERIFITGVGIVSPLGNDKSEFVSRVNAGASLDKPSVQSEVGRKDFDECGLKMSFYRKLDRFSSLQAVSGMKALKDADLTVTQDNAFDIGIVVGTCDGPISTICSYQQDILNKGTAGGSAFKFPNTVYNAAGGYLSICSGIQGYNVTLTNGIQSGLASLAYAVNILRSGHAKAVLATGNDENSEIVTELYEKMGYFNEGFHLSDGSTTIVLESESQVNERGAFTYAQALGYGMACEPTDFEHLPKSKEALVKAINFAFLDAKISATDIDAVIGFDDGLNKAYDTERMALKDVFAKRADSLPLINIHDIVGEGRAATATLSAVYGALILSGEMGENVKTRSCGEIKADTLNTLLVISYGACGTYTAVILKGRDKK